jgi:membrane-associated phospholipid phosphatase
MWTGAVLVGVTLAAGLVFHRHPGPTSLDHFGFRLLTPVQHSSSPFEWIADLGDLPVLLVGSVAAALVALRRDRRRAIACLLGPLLAVVVADWVLKPLIARRYFGVLTYPSGSMTAIASLATVWVLAVPGRLRWVVAIVGGTVVVAVFVAVIALRWHYPTDALGGAAFGFGMVLLTDGLLHSSTLTRSLLR